MGTDSTQEKFLSVFEGTMQERYLFNYEDLQKSDFLVLTNLGFDDRLPIRN